MTDLIKILLAAGNGGNGWVSFRREKYVAKGGPDGGNGGNGGNIIIKGTRHLTTLKHLSSVDKIKAEDGQAGSKRQRTGHQAEDTVIEVPVGTIIWGLAENQTGTVRRQRFGLDKTRPKSELRMERYYVEKESETIPGREPDAVGEDPLGGSGVKNIDLKDVEKIKLAEIVEDGQTVLLCQGGYGGRGNAAFKAPDKTTPLEAEYGTPGEQRLVLLELKLLADVGLVGFPNAGKSTFLSTVTKARPKIAAYPFTTLEPFLGTLSLDEVTKGSRRELVLADIPGLIEGASQGVGLGHDFLRHVEGSKVLLFILFLEEESIFDEKRTESEKAALVWKQYQDLVSELKQYNPDLLKKPSIVSVNKADLYSEELIKEIKQLFKSKGEEVTIFSTATGQGIPELQKKLIQVV